MAPSRWQPSERGKRRNILGAKQSGVKSRKDLRSNAVTGPLIKIIFPLLGEWLRPKSSIWVSNGKEKQPARGAHLREQPQDKRLASNAHPLGGRKSHVLFGARRAHIQIGVGLEASGWLRPCYALNWLESNWRPQLHNSDAAGACGCLGYIAKQCTLVHSKVSIETLANAINRWKLANFSSFNVGPLCPKGWNSFRTVFVVNRK